MTDKLTVQRLFSDPPLNSPLPGQVRFAPDGSLVTFTLLSEDDRERQDLFAADTTTGVVTRLIGPELSEAGGSLSAEDRERLERQRMFVGGVTDYAWFADGSAILLPLSGKAWRFELADGSLKEIAPNIGPKGDVRLSATGRYATYVVSGDLYFTDLSSDETRRVTDDANATITNGVADFIAQEEMHRFEGYWWQPDDEALVYTRVDTSPIPLTRRQEIHADGATMVEQRYPFAGGPNAHVSLYRFDLSTGRHAPLDVPLEDEDYLARVGYVNGTLTAQVQDRAQQTLYLYGLETSGWQVWREEHSDTWVNLHDNVRGCGDGRLLWTSEAEGLSRLYLGKPGALKPLAPADLHVTAVRGVSDGMAWVEGWRKTPTEAHLFAVRLDNGQTKQLTREPGVHKCVVHADSGRFVAAWSNVSTPPELCLCDLDEGTTLATLHASRIDDKHPYAPFLPAHRVPAFGTVLAEDGATLHYRLTPPLGLERGEQAPVIVYVYGGPGAQKVRNEWGPLLLQLFAHHGFGVFELDNRGSANRGRHFEAPIYKRMGGPEVRDQVAGLEVLGSYDWVDTNRLGVFGHSYGGYMTLMCLCQGGNAFRAGVSAAPVSDWRLYDTHYTERYMGHPQADRQAYDASCVLPWLERLEAPLLLMHGMADDNVLFTHSTMLMRELQRLNKPFELMTYPGSRHGLQERDVSIHRFELILDFFRRRL